VADRAATGPTAPTVTTAPTETTGLTARGSDGSDGEDGSDGDDVPATVGIVYSDGGLGDNSFNDAAQQGILQAEEEFGIEYDESEPDGAGEFGQFQQLYASSTDPEYDLVSCIGFNQGTRSPRLHPSTPIRTS